MGPLGDAVGIAGLRLLLCLGRDKGIHTLLLYHILSQLCVGVCFMRMASVSPRAEPAFTATTIAAVEIGKQKASHLTAEMRALQGRKKPLLNEVSKGS